MDEKTVKAVLDGLDRAYPDAGCALRHKDPFELLVATVLSAQTTDESVNRVTPELFRRWPDAHALSKAGPEDVGEVIRRIGLYHNKARNIVALAARLCETHGGTVPDDFDELLKLPGVGRKTANVVLSVGFGIPRLAVDTHVFRVANRIGLAQAAGVLETERQLMALIPESRWIRSHHDLIFHGRRCCHARRPACSRCPIAGYCLYQDKI